MSNSSDSEQPPVITEQAETITIEDVETPLALPPPPPTEDEWEPSPENTNTRASSTTYSLYAVIPVILGVFSLLLMILCGFFGYQYFRGLQASESKMKNLNQWIESFQKKSEIFTEAQRVLDQNKETLQQIRNQNIFLIEALQEFNKANQGDRCGSPLNHWIQYKDTCYHKTWKKVTWFNCTSLCVSFNATFLKIGSPSLMNFLKLYSVSHTWLEEHNKEEDKELSWEDDAKSSLDPDLSESTVDMKKKCPYLNALTIGTDDCSKYYSCMCEKNAQDKL
ncbi:PREDICTED: killer cell lectin-like receptor 2-like [Elephantulus edwardii]|uniref:killer cell lectin-like receptor 2-like n=1 Tax=Elephantulus edwardii TaxID=28737 RepID=UPI0003F07038|nr:PREDICTED: killer cell lectin-like receptor 2-like [Elephantulus edwardii]